MINMNLLKERKIEKENAFEILRLHHKREIIFLEMKYSDDIEFIKIKYNELKNIEFELQELWGFEQNENYHFLIGKGYIPHCECPYLDNKDLIGTDIRIYNENCPIHGK